ncbi:MAG: hypothetical protein HY703_08125 [Gemmatimonadetes bacterium]|nr:hypothetical protein [Gemmatimonadota bacterium]
MILTVLRLSLAYTLVASALFAGGVLDNHLNSTLPRWMVLGLGVLLAAGLAPRWAAVLVALWLLYVVPVNLFSQWFFPGLDAVKREIPLLVGATLYAMAGADRWTWPRRGLLGTSGAVRTHGADPFPVKAGQ